MRVAATAEVLGVKEAFPLFAAVPEGKIEPEVAAQLADPALTPVRILHHDLVHFGAVQQNTWQRYHNEKRSLAAETLTTLKHSRPDEYLYDPATGDVIVTETDGINPRYTMAMVYRNGYERSRAEAIEDPSLAFQLRRDELFQEAWSVVEQMLQGKTEFDTLKMISTLPVEGLRDKKERAARAKKFYDLTHGKQFEYIFRVATNAKGQKILQMFTSTLYSPETDVLHDPKKGTTYGKQAAAAILRANGHSDVPFEMIQSDEYGAYLMRTTTGDVPLSWIMEADRQIYDGKLKDLTGNAYHHGKADEAIEAYSLFDQCKDLWAANVAYDEMLAKHLIGAPLNPYLQQHLSKILNDYSQQDKYNDSLTEHEQSQLEWAVRKGQIPSHLIRACSKIMSYAHHALLKDESTKSAQDRLVQHTPVNVLEAYNRLASQANYAAIQNGERFDGCEDGNGVTDREAMKMAAKQGISFEEAKRRLESNEKQKFEAVAFKGCRSCETEAEVGKCDVCEDCQTAHDKGGDIGLAIYSAIVKKRRISNQKGIAGVNRFEHRGQKRAKV